MEETGEKKPDDETENNSKNLNTDDSLSLSLTPPIPEDNKKESDRSYESISEHLTSNSGSIENDRSFQEIEVSNRPVNILFNLDLSDEEEHISREPRPPSLEASFCSDNSIISLNFIDRIDVRNMDVKNNVRSILEEILHNEQFDSSDGASLENSKEESLNIFANVDLDDNSLNNFRTREGSLNEKNLICRNFDVPLLRHESDVEKRLKDFEELIAVKESTIAALTSELDSYRELSNTNSTSMVSTTEYKQLQEECHNKLLEYNSAIIYKNDLIQQLSGSLDKSISERKELLKQVDVFKEEIALLQKQLQDTSKMIKEHECTKEVKEAQRNLPDDLKKVQSLEKDEDADNVKEPDSVKDLEVNYSEFEKDINAEEKNLFKSLRSKIDVFVKQCIAKDINSYKEEISKLKEKNILDKEDYDTEITKLRDLLANIKCGSTEIMDLKNELEAKHSKEMEELRTYFEKKCVDLEKNYSEEIFSQQSRKMSGSTCSEAELNSDLLFSHPPGPDGDMRLTLEPNLTKKDLTNLKNELNILLDKINKYNVENITEEDFGSLKAEIGNCNLNILLKYDLTVIKNDLRNKYHAELEVMREDNENRMDLVNVEQEARLKSLEGRYLEEIENLKCQLDEMTRQNMSMSSAVQEVASSGEFEITEVIQSYERRLQEQVTLAKIDIISALESQIQRLAANEADDEEWPSELLRLRDRFTDKYEYEIQQMKEEHQREIEKLKEEHMKILNGALERARRRSLRDNDSLSKGELEILKERDNLKKQVSSLRNLLGELLKYFTQCEDELNNTLVDELLKQGFDKNVSQLEEDLNLNDSSATNSSRTGDSVTNVTRVHLTPNFSDLINLIETDSQEECDSRDISIDLKNELDICLEKLRQEANAILALTTNMPKQGTSNPNGSPKNGSLEDKVSSLTRQLITEAQTKKKLKDELNEMTMYVESLEREKETLEKQLDEVIVKANMLEDDLIKARDKIAELIENGHREIVSEGYGEEGSAGLHGLEDTMTVLAELQEKARNMLGQSRTSADPSLCQLIEQLCAISEKIKEESQKERLDLLQQIDAADKKYRTTQKFLEDQAAERELERDEAQKKIDQLGEQLRERDRDRANCERYNSEVEHLDQQLQEMTRQLADEALKCKEAESERNEAVEKIKVLRDIIRELEIQSETKTKEVEDCLDVIQKLECIVDQQHRSINELRPNDSLGGVSDIHKLQRHIDNLELELQQSRVNSELAGNEGVLKQINVQLGEIEAALEKKTKVLEVLHSTETNCSSPSEDISARDVVQPRPSNMDECEVPLQQLARLKEKLVRHSRAEDAAVKRIRDLEMQVFGLKNELEETGNEKEYMKKQVQEQLVLISDLQIRLDEQRIRADHIEKQTNTSLELKIYDLQNEIVSIREKLEVKNKLINNQQILLNDTQNRLKMLENELSSPKEDEILIAMQKELEMLRNENSQMKKKISSEAQIVPNLVENIISDKNIDIEKLREKLQETEKLLETYTSLNLDRGELHALSNLKHSGTSLEEVLSIIDLSQAEQIRKMESRNEGETLNVTENLGYKRGINETVFLGSSSEPEISTIEKVGPSNVHYSREAPLTKPNSTEIYKSLEKRVHFEDSVDVESLRNEVAMLRRELESKENVIKGYEERLQLLNNLEGKIEKLQSSLEETEKALANATETFEKEQQELRDSEKNLGVQLAEAKLHLSEREKRIEVLERDSIRKDEMCMNITKEKKQLEKALNTAKQDNFMNVDRVIKEKNDEMERLQLSLQASNSEELDSLKQELNDRNMEAISLQTEKEYINTKMEKLMSTNKVLEEKLKHAQEENHKVQKELQNNAVQIESVTTEMNNLREKVSKKRRKIKELEDAIEKQERSLQELELKVKRQHDIIVDRECEIEIANEDAKRYQNDLASLEEKIQILEKRKGNETVDKIREEVQGKDAKIEELNKEKAHLQELLNEKDKIINQISEDSHKLHVNLVTIQAKLKETGNIIDLGNKLKEEQKRTAELVEEIHELKAKLLQHEMAKKTTDMTASVDEITDQLKRELDYSAQIDSNIICAISDQSLSSISETQDVEIYKKALSKEKAAKVQLTHLQEQLKKQIVELEEKCSSLQSFNEELQRSLERKSFTLHQTEVEDAKLIQQMRIQLDTVLDKEEALEKVVEEERTARKKLETELEEAKRKTNSSSSKTESTEYKTLPSKEAMQLNHLRKELEILQGENAALEDEVRLLKAAKEEMENSYRYTKEMLSLEVQKGKGLEDRVTDMVQNERELRERLSETKAQLEGRLREMERQKIVMNEMEQEKAHLSKQKQELIQRLKTQTLNETQNGASSPVPDILLAKIKELNNALIDNKKLVDLIQKISNDKKNLERELGTVKGRATNLPFNDLVARSDYLFAKTLKLESTKKALIWQKRYLLDYLHGHQRHCLVEALPQNLAYRNDFQAKRSPKERFRSAVIVIISIVRMKYLVRRWHSGVRIAEAINSRHYRHPTRSERPASTQFQVGQPVSSQLFSANVGGQFNVAGPRNLFVDHEDSQENAYGFYDDGRISPATARDNPPWSGNTPPSKESSSRTRIRIGPNVLSREDMTPLKAPQLLAQFVERFDQIQEKLGVALDTNAT